MDVVSDSSIAAVAETTAVAVAKPVPATGRAAAEKRRLTTAGGLAALSLDAMASVAYGPEAIAIVLAGAGAHGLGYTCRSAGPSLPCWGCW